MYQHKEFGPLTGQFACLNPACVMLCARVCLYKSPSPPAMLVMHAADNLALRQAAVKACTQLELANAFRQQVACLCCAAYFQSINLTPPPPASPPHPFTPTQCLLPSRPSTPLFHYSHKSAFIFPPSSHHPPPPSPHHPTNLPPPVSAPYPLLNLSPPSLLSCLPCVAEQAPLNVLCQ